MAHAPVNINKTLKHTQKKHREETAKMCVNAASTAAALVPPQAAHRPCFKHQQPRQ